MTKGKHDYGEAFMLMRYEDDIGNVEVIWNSRDGVTPFIVSSRAGRRMTHKNWHADVYAPDHEPQAGDRIFTDLTREELLEIEKINVNEWWDDEELPMKDHPVLGPLGKDGAAKYMANESWQEGMPNIVEVGSE